MKPYFSRILSAEQTVQPAATMHRLRFRVPLSFATHKPAPSASILHFSRTMSSGNETPSKKKNQGHPGCHRDMRRTFYIDAVVDKIMNKSLGHPFLMWTKTRLEWYRILRSEAGCQALLKSRFLTQLRASMQEDDFESTKRFGSEKVCLGRSFAEHKRIKRDLYHYKYNALAEAAAAERDDARISGLANEPGTAVVDSWLEYPGVSASGLASDTVAKETNEDAKEEK